MIVTTGIFILDGTIKASLICIGNFNSYHMRHEELNINKKICSFCM